MKFHHLITASAAVLALSLSATVSAEKLAVGITPDLQKLDFKHDGKSYTIMRNQDQKNTINENFAKTSRKCPPFCIQPIVLAPGVETLGEVEMIHYVKKMSEGENILVVDSRTPDWVERGTIPGAKNIPWTKLNPAKGTATDSMVLFLAINTSSITLLPTGVIALRSAAGSSDPAGILFSWDTVPRLLPPGSLTTQ